MLDTSLVVLPEIEQAIICAIQNIRRFSFELLNSDDSAPKCLNRSLLYKAHHHIQLCENNLHGTGILLPDTYIPLILLSLEKIQENNEIELEQINCILKAVQSLLEYLNQSVSIGISRRTQSKYVFYLYYPYYKLISAFSFENIKSIKEFINYDLSTDIDINYEYYAKYDFFSLKKLKDYIVNIKDNWHNVSSSISYIKQSIELIITIEWNEILPLMQCIEEYILAQKNNADLELASALLFIEYIVNEPWRIHSIVNNKNNYSLKEIIQTLIEQIYSPNNQFNTDINYIHQQVQAYAIKKSVLYQIDLLIKEAQDYIEIDITKSLDIIQKINNILQTIGFNDTNNIINKLNDKLINKDNIDIQDLNYINYIFNTLKQYIKNNYPEENKDEINKEQINESIETLENNNYVHNNNNPNNTDTELLLSFKQEQKELLFNIKEYKYELQNNPQNKDIIFSLKRCFHTFKSSFKMLDLNFQALSSGNIEQLINKYINNQDIDISVIYSLIDLSLVGLANLNNASSTELEEINDICNSFNNYSNINSETNKQNQILINANITSSSDNKNIFQTNLIFIYVHETIETLQNLEIALQQHKTKEFSKNLHKVEGSSSTVGCKSMQEWCLFIRQIISSSILDNIINDEINTLLQYSIYIAQDIVKTLNIDNINQNLSIENQDFLQQILNKCLEYSNISATEIKSDNLLNQQAQYNANNKEEKEIIDNNNNYDIELTTLFIDEAQSLHESINANINNLYLDNKADQEILRALHTLKGGARMVGLMDIGEGYHNLEDDVNKGINATLIQEKIYSLINKLDSVAQKIMLQKSNINYKHSQENIDISNHATSSNNIIPINNNIHEQSENNNNQEKAWHIKVDNKKIGEFIEKSYYIEGYISKINSQLHDAINQVQSTFAPMQQIHQLLGSLAVQEHTKNEALLSISNTNAQSHLKNITSYSMNNIGTMDSLEFDTFSNMQIQLNQSQNVNNAIISQQEYVLECLTNITELFHALQNHTTNMQQELSHLSLLSFQQIIPKLHQTCEQVAKEQKKRVQLKITGEYIKVNKTILEGVSFAFEHLIRNAINHGIELPEIRKQNNKDECGIINIDIQQQGEYMSINFVDDGQGINTQAVKNRAIEKGWILESDNVSVEQLIKYIIQPGFSTQENISQVAGRGIGLDAVVAYIKEIGGDVIINQKDKAGFSISMMLPLQSFVSDVLVCKVGDYSFGALLNNVHQINLEQNLQDINYISMSHLFNKNQDKNKTHKKIISLTHSNENYYLGIDDISLNKSMYIRKSSLPYTNDGLVGVSIINFTDILPIYNLDILIKVNYKNDISLSEDNQNNKNKVHLVGANNYHIMVIDDSSTLRFTTQKILKKYNYEVTLAIDGIDALDKIKSVQNNIDLFLVDIEMPRMGGFDLISIIRQNPLYERTPIIVISSRQIEKYQQQAYDVGANDFLGKPYQTAQLMSHITRELTKANIGKNI